MTAEKTETSDKVSVNFATAITIFNSIAKNSPLVCITRTSETNFTLTSYNDPSSPEFSSSSAGKIVSGVKIEAVVDVDSTNIPVGRKILLPIAGLMAVARRDLTGNLQLIADNPDTIDSVIVKLGRTRMETACLPIAVDSDVYGSVNSGFDAASLYSKQAIKSYTMLPKSIMSALLVVARSLPSSFHIPADLGSTSGPSVTISTEPTEKEDVVLSTVYYATNKLCARVVFELPKKLSTGKLILIPYELLSAIRTVISSGLELKSIYKSNSDYHVMFDGGAASFSIAGFESPLHSLDSIKRLFDHFDLIKKKSGVTHSLDSSSFVDAIKTVTDFFKGTKGDVDIDLIGDKKCIAVVGKLSAKNTIRSTIKAVKPIDINKALRRTTIALDSLLAVLPAFVGKKRTTSSVIKVVRVGNALFLYNDNVDSTLELTCVFSVKNNSTE